MSLSLTDSAVAKALPGAAELSVVVPTFKERGNVAELVRRLDASLAGTAWEAIFVDDNSPDGTAADVPSGELSSTKIASQAMPVSAASSRRTSSATLPRSL